MTILLLNPTYSPSTRSPAPGHPPTQAPMASTTAIRPSPAAAASELQACSATLNTSTATIFQSDNEIDAASAEVNPAASSQVDIPPPTAVPSTSVSSSQLISPLHFHTITGVQQCSRPQSTCLTHGGVGQLLDWAARRRPVVRMGISSLRKAASSVTRKPSVRNKCLRCAISIPHHSESPRKKVKFAVNHALTYNYTRFTQ